MNSNHQQPPTEQRNPLSENFDQLATVEMLRLMNQLDATVPLVVAAALPTLAAAVDVITAKLAAGGRLFYMGAGTSGRLAVLDAAELRPTFSLPPGVVIALIAGGAAAITEAVEGAEDDQAQGRRDLIQHHFGAGDVLLGIAASGRTPYVLGGLAYANEIGAATIALVNNPASPMAAAAQLALELVTGPEVITGSTRLRAGTAQKLALNMISSAVMVKLGKVYGNWMVDVQPSNAKLRQRAIRIVSEICGAEARQAEAWLTAAGWQVKTAVVMGLLGCDADVARQRLAKNNGMIRTAVG